MESRMSGTAYELLGLSVGNWVCRSQIVSIIGHGPSSLGCENKVCWEAKAYRPKANHAVS